MKRQRVTGIILAGGMSSRMGADKSLLVFSGKTLIENAINILRPVCSEIVISAPENRYGFTGLECWPDIIEVKAAMAGVYSCLKRSVTKLNLILGCDMPLVDPLFLADLISDSAKADLIIPVHDGNRYEPLCSVYKKNLLASLTESLQRGEYGLLNFALSSNYSAFVCENTPHFKPGMFTNVNTATDFDLLVSS